MAIFRSKSPARRRVECPLCGEPLLVGQRTESTVCPHCNKSIDVSDHTIDFYCAKKRLETSGDVLVETEGTLRGEIRAARVVVKGRLLGAVHARISVEVAAGGVVEGAIFAPILRVEEGGRVIGGCRAGAGVPPSRAVPAGVLR